jgi:hypothetical protein
MNEGLLSAAPAPARKTTPRATTRKPTQMTGAELKFLRDEILKVMVSSVAAAKAETLGAFELSNKASLHRIGMLNAGSNHGAVCLACAIVAALGESGVLDPNHVIRWATWMAENQPPEIEGAVSETAARMLQNFTKILEGFASRN